MISEPAPNLLACIARPQTDIIPGVYPREFRARCACAWIAMPTLSFTHLSGVFVNVIMILEGHGASYTHHHLANSAGMG